MCHELSIDVLGDERDFETAIGFGVNHVRVGTASFGVWRPPPTRQRWAEEPEGKKEGELRFVISAEQWAYLGWLRRNTVLGRNETEVARQILTARLSEMRQENFQDGQRT